MSFAEIHQQELAGVNSSVFGEKGIVDSIAQLHEIVIFLGEEVKELSSKDTPQLKQKIRENRLRGNHLCDVIEKELQQLQHPKKKISGSHLETTEEIETRQKIAKIVNEFYKVKNLFSQLHFRTKSVEESVSSSSSQVLLESQLTFSELKEIKIDFEKEHRELVQELEELLDLFEDFRDIVSEQAIMLDEVAMNSKGSLEELNVVPLQEITKPSHYGSFTIPVILGGGIGAFVGGPLGAAFGMKAGVVLSGMSLGVSAGLATGMGLGYYFKKKKDTAESEWEWVKKK